MSPNWRESFTRLANARAFRYVMEHRYPILGLVTAFAAALIFIVPGNDAPAQVRTGAQVLVDTDFDLLAGKRVALVMNQSASIGRPGETTLDAFLATTRCRLVALFAPEHGIDGQTGAGDAVADVIEPKSGLTVRSLYGATKKPTREMLRGVDVVVYDIQDIGVRSYTFISTLIKVMEGCADAEVPLIVLDRPNPIGGDVVDGPVLDTAWRSFIGIVPIPYVHGMTAGELAMMANGEAWLQGGRSCRLTVVRMRGWRRSMTWGETGLSWVATSPNIRSPESAFANAVTGGIGELRIANIGIGTPDAFQFVAGEWMRARPLAAWLNAQRLPGLVFTAMRDLPPDDQLSSRGNGVRIARVGELTRPFTAQIALLVGLRDICSDHVVLGSIGSDRWQMFDKVCGTDNVRKGLLSGLGWEDIAAAWQEGLDRFIARRENYLLYE